MASTYLTRTFGTPTNGYKYTISFWVKRSKLGVDHIAPMTAGTYGGGSATNMAQFLFTGSDNLLCQVYNAGGTLKMSRDTNRKFRDTNAWYHIVLGVDGTLGTAADRQKLYVNGEQITSFDSSTNIDQNADMAWNQNGIQCMIGNRATTSYYFDGCLSHVHFIDGTQYAASDFGETDATTGIWKPKPNPGISSSNYGNNGFFLKFDNSANMGLDSSGNSNNWTTSGTIIQNKDTPSNNFAKLNFNDIAGTNDITLANTGTTTMQTSNVGDYGLRSTLAATTGKYYWEAKIATSNTLCILPMETRLVINLSDGSPVGDLYGVQRYSDSTSNIYDDGTFVQNTSAMWGGITSSDIISFALDLTNGKLFLAKNGAYKNQSGATGDPVNGTNPTFTISDTTKTYTFYTEMRGNDNNGTLVNFGDGYFGTTAVSSAQNPDDGHGIFEYDVPAGYRAWTTKGINAQEYS